MVSSLTRDKKHRDAGDADEDREDGAGQEQAFELVEVTLVLAQAHVLPEDLGRHRCKRYPPRAYSTLNESSHSSSGCECPAAQTEK